MGPYRGDPITLLGCLAIEVGIFYGLAGLGADGEWIVAIEMIWLCLTSVLTVLIGGRFYQKEATTKATRLAGCWRWGSSAAIGASALYNTSIALQALEAREVGHEHALRAVADREADPATRAGWWRRLIGLLGWPLEIVGAAAGAADRGPALPRQRAGAAALARRDAGSGRARGRASTGRSRRSWSASPGSPGRRPNGRPSNAGRGADRDRPGAGRDPDRSLLTWCAGGAGAAGTLAVVAAGFGYAWTAIASKLLTDELSAGLAAGRRDLARHRRRLGGARAAERDERPAASARRPGSRR